MLKCFYEVSTLAMVFQLQLFGFPSKKRRDEQVLETKQKINQKTEAGIICQYRIFSVCPIPMTRLRFLIRIHFLSPKEFFDSSIKQIFRDTLGTIFLYYHENICRVYSLELPRRGYSNGDTKYVYRTLKRR